MTRPKTTDSEQALIDTWVRAVHEGHKPSDSQWDALTSFILGLADDMYNCTWPGFHGCVSLGLGVYLDGVIAQRLEQAGQSDADATNDEERISYFRDALDEEMYRTSGYFCHEMRAPDGRSAWVGFSQNDAAEIDVVGVFCTPLMFEEHLRAEGLIFPNKEEPRPSGRLDEFSDAQVLELLKRLSALRPRRTGRARG